MITGKDALISSIKEAFSRQDLISSSQNKKGIDLQDSSTKQIIATAVVAMGDIESGFKNLATYSDNGNNSAGMLAVGPDAAKSVQDSFQVGNGLSNTDMLGNTVLGTGYLMMGLGKSQDERIDPNELKQDFEELINASEDQISTLASGKDNLLVETVRDYNGGLDNGGNNDATVNHATKFIKAIREHANDPALNTFA